MTILNENKKKLLYKLIKQLNNNFSIEKLKDLAINVNGTFSSIFELTNFIDYSISNGELSEILFSHYLDSNNLPYQAIIQEQDYFYSNVIMQNSQRCDFIIKNYHVDLKLQKMWNDKFTLNLKHFKDYTWYNNNIAPIYIIFMKKSDLLSNNVKLVFILKFSDFYDYVNSNNYKHNSKFTYYSIPNDLLREVKLTELSNYFL